MQGRFGQDEMPLANREAALAEVAGLPLPEGERRLLHRLGLAALDAGAASLDRVGVRRAALAEALGVAPGTVSRQAGRLVERGLVERIPVGRERAWAIVWPAVWNFAPVELVARPKSRKSRPVAESVFAETPAERVSESHCRSQWHTSVWCARVALVLLWPLAIVARRVCAAEQILACRARALVERTGADVSHEDCHRAHAKRSGVARVQLALPFAAEITGGRGVERAPAVVTCDAASAQPRQLSQEAKEQPASSGGGKAFFRVQPDELKTPAAIRGLFERCRQRGWVSPEEWPEFVAWTNSVRRRSNGRLVSGEKAIRSTGGYASRILEAGTWRDDIRREDREWLKEQMETERAREQRQPAGVGG